MLQQAPTNSANSRRFLDAAGDDHEHRQYAELGVCENVESTIQRRCAIQAAECAPTYLDENNNVKGEKWYNAYSLKQRGLASSVPCSCEETFVGACIEPSDDNSSVTGWEYRCAPHQDACQQYQGEPFSFVSKLQEQAGTSCTCSSQQGIGAGGDIVPTLYGACKSGVSSEAPANTTVSSKDEQFCAYSPTDCEAGYLWVPPTSVKSIQMEGLASSYCDCQNVRVGGCVGDGLHSRNSFLHCAVTADDCSWDHYYVPPLSLEQTHGMQCRLCRPTPERSSSSSRTSNGGSPSSPKTIAGISMVVVGCVSVVSVLLLLFKMMRRETPDLVYETGVLTSTKETVVEERALEELEPDEVSNGSSNHNSCQPNIDEDDHELL